MNDRKQTIQKYRLHLLLIVIVLAVMGTTIVRYVNKMSIATRESEHVLGYPTRIGAVGAEVFYNVSPVEVVLISPSGQEYDRSRTMLYYVNQDAKVITVKVSTQETGEWKIRFANGLNTQLSYRMLNQASDALYMDDVHLVTDDGPIPKISFMPVYGEPTDAPEISYTVTLRRGNDFSYVIASGTAFGNEENRVELDIPDFCYTGESYVVTLAASNDVGQTLHVNTDIYLMKRETASQNDTPDTEEGDETGESEETEQ